MRLSVLLLIAAVLLGGCIGSDVPSSPTGNTSDRTPRNDTSLPRNTTPATPERSDRATRWVESYWGSREEVVLVDATGQVATGLSNSMGQFGSCLAAPCQPAFFRPSDGAIVAPGTANLTVTASWSPPPTAPGMQVTLFYQTAEGGSRKARPSIPNGEPVNLSAGSTAQDAALQPASLWSFGLWAVADPAGTIPPTDVQLQVVAERGPSLPDIPPAPEPQNGSGTSVLVDGRTHTVGLGAPPAAPCVLPPCLQLLQGAWWESGSGSRVTEDHAKVRATLTWSRPLPVPPQLEATHPGGTVAMEMVEEDDRRRVFETPVPAEGVDSPWQSRSLWKFSATFETQGREGGVVTGDFTLTAEAVGGNATQGS